MVGRSNSACSWSGVLPRDFLLSCRMVDEDDTYYVQLTWLVRLCFDRARGCGEVASSEIALA